MNADQQSFEQVQRTAPNFAPQIGIILGSGLGALAEEVEQPVVISYASLSSFPRGQVHGHAGKLVLGSLAGKRVAVFAGRFHFYQGFTMRDVTAPVRLLAALGAKQLLVTNAAGGVSARLRPGDLMAIDDHINFMGANPLVGELRDGKPIFQDMTEAYSLRLRKNLLTAAKKEKIPLKHGVYLACSGPSYETPAEIRAFAKLGADAVGMSTVPEVIAARAAGLEVCGLSCITNYAAGRTKQKLAHTEVLEVGARVQGKTVRLVKRFISLV